MNDIFYHYISYDIIHTVLGIHVSASLFQLEVCTSTAHLSHAACACYKLQQKTQVVSYLPPGVGRHLGQIRTSAASPVRLFQTRSRTEAWVCNDLQLSVTR